MLIFVWVSRKGHLYCFDQDDYWYAQVRLKDYIDRNGDTSLEYFVSQSKTQGVWEVMAFSMKLELSLASWMSVSVVLKQDVARPMRMNEEASLTTLEYWLYLSLQHLVRIFFKWEWGQKFSKQKLHMGEQAVGLNQWDHDSGD